MSDDAVKPNYEDYWLQNYDRDERGWRSAAELVSTLRNDEVSKWSPEDDAAEALIRHDTERGGGVQGATPELLRIRSALIASGERAVAWEIRLKEMARPR